MLSTNAASRATGEFFGGALAWPPLERAVKPHIRFPLFKYAEHGEIPMNAAYGLGDDAAALVADEERLHAPPTQLVHELAAAGSGELLRTGGREVHVLLGDVPFPQQLLARLEKAHDAALCV